MPSTQRQDEDRGPFLDHPGCRVPFGSNAVRLGIGSWLAAATIMIALYLGLPRLWTRFEPLDTGPDYRIPSALSEDYWLYARYAETATANERTVPIIGDSVIWGQYVTPQQTLSHALNAECGESRFANLGVNGSHPIALAGLLDNYGAGIANRRVLLHFNPLWLSSPRRDLTITKPTSFNHPRLVPQFFPRIPCYSANTAERLSIAIARQVPFLGWTAHLRAAYFNSESLPAWTIERPYANPASAITRELPLPENTAPSEPIPWTEKDTRLQSFDWVSPSDSLQWDFFKRSVTTLQRRGNSVFVLVGPFNEHMLTEENRNAYQALEAQISAWLEQNGIAYASPEPLPSETYADASHPIESGYVILARQLLGDASFKKFLEP